jgi:hypothetical protein
LPEQPGTERGRAEHSTELLDEVEEGGDAPGRTPRPRIHWGKSDRAEPARLSDEGTASNQARDPRHRLRRDDRPVTQQLVEILRALGDASEPKSHGQRAHSELSGDAP